MNMRPIRRSRKPIRAGDIFALKVLPKTFHFGRVINAEVLMIEWTSIMVYIYRATSDDLERVPELDKRALLIPPLLVANSMWSRGYFTTVDHRLLRTKDVLRVHCFRDLAKPKVPYCDEFGRPLRRRTEPCGVYGIAGEGVVDDELSDALGIPRSAESLAEDRRHARALVKSQERRRKLMASLPPELVAKLREYGVTD